MAEILLNVKINTANADKDLEALKKKIGELAQKGLPRTSIDSVNSLQKAYANLLSTLKNVESKYPKGTFSDIKNQLAQNLEAVKKLNDGYKQHSETLKTYQDQLSSLGKRNKSNAKEYDELKAKIQGQVSALATNQKQVKKLGDEYSNLSTTMATVRAQTEQNNSAVVKTGDSILSLAKKFITWQMAATAVMQPLNLIRNSLSSLNETLVTTEDTVVNITRVINENVSKSEISKELYGIAQEFGQTFENVSEIATNFARAGLSWTDTLHATRAAVLALNVAELDATQASDGLIAVMTQFKINAEDLTGVIDKLNITGDNAAVTTEKLLTALQRTGSTAKNAKLSLEETIGVITALSEATGRSGENLGTAINSLLNFSGKASSLATFKGLGGNVAGSVDAYEKGQGTILDIWRELSKVIKETNANSKDLERLFAGDDWKNLNAELQNQLGENFAKITEIYDTSSAYRKNYFIALLNNMDKVEEAVGTLQNAEGYSQQENLQYMDTYTAKVNQLKSQWEEMANDEQGFLAFKKDLVDIGIILLDVVKAMGGVGSTVAYVVTGLMAFNTTIKLLSGNTNSLGDKLANLIKNITTTTSAVGKMKERFNSFANTIENFPKAFSNYRKAAKEVEKATKTLATLQAEGKQNTEEYATATTAKATADKNLTAAETGLTAATTALGTAFNAVLLSIQIFIIVITAIVGAVNKARQKNQEFAEQQLELAQNLNEVTQKLHDQNEELRENANTLQAYRDIVNNVNASEEERKQALEDLIKLSSEIAEKYGINNTELLKMASNYDTIGDAIDRYIEKVEKLQKENTANEYKSAQEAAKQAKAAVAASKSSIKLVSDEYARRGFINAGITEGTEDFGVAGANVYGATYLDIPASKSNLALLKKWRDNLSSKVSESDGLKKKQYKAALGKVNSAIEDMDEVLKALDDAQNAETKAFAANELYNNSALFSNLQRAKSNDLEARNAYDALLAQIDKSTEYTEAQKAVLYALVSDELAEYIAGYSKIRNSSKQQLTDLKEIAGAYDDLIARLKELRNTQQESLDYEEKKKAVLEAQKALLEAQNDLNVRVFNSATGQWEWQANAANIQKTEETLAKAQQSIEKAAYDEIIAALEEGNTDNQSILNILDKWSSIYGEEMPQFVTAIKEAIKAVTGVDVDAETTQTSTGQLTDTGRSLLNKVSNGLTNFSEKVKNFFGNLIPKYDSGGVLQGLGGIKATADDEVVLPPNLASKILEPSSNQQFAQFSHDLGLLFGASKEYATNAPQTITNSGGNSTTNYVTNNSVNGINIPQDIAERYSIIDLFEYMQ